MDFDILESLLVRHGEPLNIHNVAPFIRNINDFNDVVKGKGIKFTPYFARKANKALCYVEQAQKMGIGIDSASFHEVKQSLDIGFPAERIISTAAVKPPDLLELCANEQILVVLDNNDEIEHLAELARSRSVINPVQSSPCGVHTS